MPSSEDMQKFAMELSKQRRSMNEFQVSALQPAREFVVVRHLGTGIERTYPFSIWISAFAAHLAQGVFLRKDLPGLAR